MNPGVLAKSLCWELLVVSNNCSFLTFHACIAHNRVNLLISSCNMPRDPLVKGTENYYIYFFPIIFMFGRCKGICRLFAN